MPGLANVFFRDMCAHLNGGIPGAATALATGTTSGSAIQLSGPNSIGKLLFRLLLTKGSANAGASMWLATATASGGAFTSISQTLVSATVSLASQYFLEIDTRNEAFANLGTGSPAPLWVMAVVALATTATPVMLDVLGWQAGVEPASGADATAGVIVNSVTFY